MQIGRIAYLKPAVRQAFFLRALLCSLNKVPRDIDTQHIGSESRLWQCRRSIAASQIQDLHPFRDAKLLDECVSTLPHALCDASKVAFFPQRLIRIHGCSLLVCVPENNSQRAFAEHAGFFGSGGRYPKTILATVP